MEGVYTIYHQSYINDPFPEEIAKIDAESVEQAWQRTQNIGFGRWRSNGYVVSLTDINRTRSSMVGDVIKDPNNVAYVVRGSGFELCEDFE